METDADDWGTPQLDAIEDKLMQNYTEFQIDALAWTREWQRGINRRAMQRKRAHERAQSSDAPLERDIA